MILIPSFALRVTFIFIGLILLRLILPAELKAAQCSPASQDAAWSGSYSDSKSFLSSKTDSPRRWDPANWQPWVRSLVYLLALALSIGLGTLAFGVAWNLAFTGVSAYWIIYLIVGGGGIGAVWLSSGVFNWLKGFERGWVRWLSRLGHLALVFILLAPGLINGFFFLLGLVITPILVAYLAFHLPGNSNP